jgi:SNF2 family DNA or RNA helicase
VIRAEKVGRRIHVRFGQHMAPAQFQTAKGALNRAIPSASFSKKAVAWTMALDMSVCRILRKEFGKQLEIGPDLWEWAAEQVRVEKEAVRLLKATSANLDRLGKDAPDILNRMEARAYQKAVVAYGALQRRYVNGSQPGLGKTLETLGSIVEANNHGMHLIIAPKTSLRSVWEPEIASWLGWPTFVTTGSKERRMSILDAALSCWRTGKHSDIAVVINAQMVNAQEHYTCLEPGCLENADDPGVLDHSDRHKKMTWVTFAFPQLFEMPWQTQVVDETHKYLLNTQTSSKKVSQVGRGAMMLPLADDGMRIALSGTPFKGKAWKVWGTLHWIDPQRFSSFWAWAQMFFHVDENRHGGKVIGGVKDEEEFGRMLDSVMIRHTKAEVLPQLPPKQYGGTRLDPYDEESPIRVWLDMEPKQEKAYRQMEAEAEAHLDSGKLTANGILAELTRLKQFATTAGDVRGDKFVPILPSAKFDWIEQFLDEMGVFDGEGTGKVVIASQFTSVINLFDAALRAPGLKMCETLVLTGQTSDKRRQENVQRFQAEGGPRVFLLNTNAGGVSITLDAADDLILIDETWIPDDQEQVEDRVHRTSRIHQVNIWILCTRETIDQSLAVNSQADDNLQKQILDGRRGVSFAKKMLVRS